MDFVYVAIKDSSIRHPESYLLNVLQHYCVTNEVLKPLEEENDHTFYNFLFSHISVALSKGFDDNVGRHNVVPVFEKPTIKEFFTVFEKLNGLLFDESDPLKTSGKIISTHIRNCLDTDIGFSESRCSKELLVAFSSYQEGLPSHYTRDHHERKVAAAMQQFSLHARGPAIYNYAAKLKEECDRCWNNDRKLGEDTP